MKIKLLSLFVTILCICPAFSQKNFRTEYHTFRFKLHDLLDEDNPMRISSALAQYVSSFLKDHAKEIPDFRVSQLQDYERDAVDEPKDYTTLAESDLMEIRKMAILITTKKELIEMLEKDKGNEAMRDLGNNKDIDNLSIMLEFLSVSPLELILLTNGTILPSLLNNYAHIPNDRFGEVFGRLGVTGYYLSAKKKDKSNWIVIVNTYHTINSYAVNINTGQINLTEVRIRK
jgi:hypothetical protein